MPEHTHALQKIFNNRLLKNESNSKENLTDSHSLRKTINSGNSQKVLTTGYVQLYYVSLSLARTADTAICGALELVERTMNNVDRFSGFSNNWSFSIENEIRMAEAELLDVSESIKSTLENVFRQGAVNNAEEMQTYDISISQVDGSLGQKAVNRVNDLLVHVERILEEERTAVAAARIQLTLCKEELREFKNRQLFLASGGVKPFNQGLWNNSLFSNNEKKEKDSNDVILRQPDSAECSPPLPAMQLRMVTGSKTLLESVVKRVSNTVKEADDVFTRQLLKSSAGKPITTNEGSVVSDRGLGKCKENFFLPLQYTPEEESQLLTQHAALEEQQRKLLADDAVAVEVAVRDLSHLNSLVSEAVLSQREKFMVLMRNTEDAQLLMKKAVEELEKPLQSFWNPKRQLIVLLWVCISIVWVSNWLIR